MKNALLFLIILTALVMPVFAQTTLDLTPEEQTWLDAHPNIRIGVDPAFAPYEFIDENGVYQGIAADYLKLINQGLGLNLKPEPDLTWGEVVEKARNQEIDVLVAVGINDERKQYLNYTKPYLSFSRAVITHTSSDATSIEDIQNMKVGVQKDSSHHGYVNEETTIEPVLFDTFQEAMLALSGGQIDAVIGNLAVSTHTIQESGLTNLKIGGIVSKEPAPLAFAVRKDWPELVSILDKALDAIPQNTKNEIVQSWVPVEFTSQVLPSSEELIRSGIQDIILDSDTFEYRLNELNQNLGILSEDRTLNNLINEEDEVIREAIREDLKQEFLTLVKNKPMYYQLRYIDENGQETIRIDNDGQNIFIVPDEELQNKKDRYYFTETMSLTEGNVFVSSFDLNIEGGELENRGTEESPVYVPVIRYATPVFDDEGEDRGIIIINIYGDWLKDLLFEFSDDDNTFYLVDDHEYFIHHPNKSREFLNMFGEETHLDQEMGEEGVSLIMTEETGSFVFNDRFFLFNRILPNPLNSNEFWVIIDEKSLEGIDSFYITSQEENWLKLHKNMILGVEPSWPPVEFVDEFGDYEGMCSDYVTIVNELLEINMVPQTDVLNWDEMIEKARKGEIDVIPCIVKTEEREEYLLFSEPYLTLPNVIITREDSEFGNDLSGMNGKTMAVVKGYAAEYLLTRDYPGINLIAFDNVEEVLKAVSDGRADGSMQPFVSLKYTTKEHDITNLVISGTTPYDINLAFAVRKDWPELIGPINKALATISEQQKKDIQDKWITTRVEQQLVIPDWAYGIMGALLFVVLVFLVANRYLKRSEQAYKHDMQERMKELKCLYSISKLIEDPKNTIQEVLKKSVQYMPPAWQFPEFATAKISYNGDDYTTKGFKPTEWNQISPISVGKKKVGAVELHYTKDLPFIPVHEKKLIDGIADTLGRFIERYTTKKELKLLKRIQESEETYKKLVDKSPIPTVVLHPDGSYDSVNRAYVQATGFLPKEIMKQNYSKFVSKEYKNTTEAAFKRVLGGGTGVKIEVGGLTKSGVKKIFDVRLELIKKQGKDRIVAVLLDITEKKQLWKKLAELQKKKPAKRKKK